MSKSKRLIELMIRMNTKRKFTVGELAEEFQVSKRTILRDLQELAEAGLPLYSEVGANGGYQILKERTLPPISFSEDEAVAMFFAVQSLQYYSSLPFQSESISALAKFYHYLPHEVKEQINELRNRITFWVPHHEQPAPFLNELVQHAIKQQVVTIEYESKARDTKREIQPIGVYSMNGLWYCPAYCFQAEEIRLFRVDRIKGLYQTDKQKPRKEITKFTIQQFLKGDGQEGELLPFVVHLTRGGVKRCESDVWLSKILTVHEDGTGRIDAKIRHSFISWAALFFLSCGPDAVVEQPEILVQEIKEKLEQMVYNYQNRCHS